MPVRGRGRPSEGSGLQRGQPPGALSCGRPEARDRRSKAKLAIITPRCAWGGIHDGSSRERALCSFKLELKAPLWVLGVSIATYAQIQTGAAPLPSREVVGKLGAGRAARKLGPLPAVPAAFLSRLPQRFGVRWRRHWHVAGSRLRVAGAAVTALHSESQPGPGPTDSVLACQSRWPTAGQSQAGRVDLGCLGEGHGQINGVLGLLGA